MDSQFALGRGNGALLLLSMSRLLIFIRDEHFPGALLCGELQLSSYRSLGL